jgi:hypothetical protein
VNPAPAELNKLAGIDDESGFSRSGFLLPIQSGGSRYLLGPQAIGGGGSGAGASMGANIYQAFPFYPNRDITADTLQVRVTTGVVGGLAHLAIYEPGADGLPSGDPVRETASFSTATSSAFAGASITSYTFEGGKLYWLFAGFNANSATIGGYEAASIPGFQLDSSGRPLALWRATWVFGTFPVGAAITTIGQYDDQVARVYGLTA